MKYQILGDTLPVVVCQPFSVLPSNNDTNVWSAIGSGSWAIFISRSSAALALYCSCHTCLGGAIFTFSFSPINL